MTRLGRRSLAPARGRRRAVTSRRTTVILEWIAAVLLIILAAVALMHLDPTCGSSDGCAVAGVDAR